MSEFEMNEMRQQMNILKKKLEQQEIVNEKLIRQSMRKNMRSINRRNFILTAIAILMVPYSYWVFYKMVGFSMAFWIGTSIFMLICAGANIWNNRNLNSSSLMSGDLLEASKHVAHAKKFDTQWLLFGIPAVLLWLAWFVYEVYRVNGPDDMMPLLLGGGFGGVIGLICGFRIYYKTQQQYQEIINQIEDLTNNN
jgi:uncharacterized membrane protein